MRRTWISLSICALLCLGSLVFGYNSKTAIPSGNGLESSSQIKEAKPDKTEGIKTEIIQVQGPFDDKLEKSVKEQTENAKKTGVERIIYVINSPGGRLDGAMKLSNYIFDMPESIQTIAYVEEQAIAAAAMFTIACDEIYMKPNSSLGDCHPIIPGADGVKIAGDKIQAPLRERFKTFSNANGYPALLAQAMVTPYLKIYRLEKEDQPEPIYMRSEDYDLLNKEELAKYSDKKIVSHRDEVLILNPEEATELGFSSGTFASTDELIQHLDQPKEEPALPKAVIIPLEGQFDKLLFTTIKRRTEEALADNIKLIIYKVNSPGGRLDVAFDLSNYVFGLSDDIRTIAFVDEQAISAAALFSLSCDDIYMKANSTIGDCEPILPGGPEGYKTMGDKVQSPLRERFRTYAKKNGYPVILAQAMVTSQLKIYRLWENENDKPVFMRSEDFDLLKEDEQDKFSKKEIVSHAGELLTMSTDEAEDLGFSEGTLPSAEDLVKHLGFQNSIPVSDLNDTESFISGLHKYSGLLLVIAIFSIYLELKTPGIGLFGAVGAVAFSVFFLGNFYTGQANYLEVMLFLLGVALLLLEVFVFPGFGIAGIAGAILMFASLILAMQDFNFPRVQTQWDILISNMATVSGSFLIATLIFAVMLFALPFTKLKLFPGLVHDKMNPEGPRKHKIDSIEDVDLKGKVGISTTPLIPGGKAEIDGINYQVAAKEGWIDKGVSVRVHTQEGNQIIVEKNVETSQSQEQA